MKDHICEMIKENNNEFTKAEKIHVDTFREMQQTKSEAGGTTFLHRNKSFLGS